MDLLNTLIVAGTKLPLRWDDPSYKEGEGLHALPLREVHGAIGRAPLAISALLLVLFPYTGNETMATFRSGTEWECGKKRGSGIPELMKFLYPDMTVRDMLSMIPEKPYPPRPAPEAEGLNAARRAAAIQGRRLAAEMQSAEARQRAERYMANLERVTEDTAAAAEAEARAAQAAQETQTLEPERLEARRRRTEAEMACRQAQERFRSLQLEIFTATDALNQVRRHTEQHQKEIRAAEIRLSAIHATLAAEPDETAAAREVMAKLRAAKLTLKKAEKGLLVAQRARQEAEERHRNHIRRLEAIESEIVGRRKLTHDAESRTAELLAIMGG